MGIEKSPVSTGLDLARALVELRQAAENEVNMLQAALNKLPNPKPLTDFEKECIRMAFKGGAVWGRATSLPKSERINGSLVRKLAGQ